jgi:hypothetical protein
VFKQLWYSSLLICASSHSSWQSGCSLQSRQPAGQSSPHGQALSHSEKNLRIFYHAKITLKLRQTAAVAQLRVAVRATFQVRKPAFGKTLVVDFRIAEIICLFIPNTFDWPGQLVNKIQAKKQVFLTCDRSQVLFSLSKPFCLPV